MFPLFIDHSQMARNMGASVDAENGDNKVVSAGFINYGLECFGKSDTLNIESNPDEDTKLAKNLMGLYPDEKITLQIE